MIHASPIYHLHFQKRFIHPMSRKIVKTPIKNPEPKALSEDEIRTLKDYCQCPPCQFGRNHLILSYIPCFTFIFGGCRVCHGCLLTNAEFDTFYDNNPLIQSAKIAQNIQLSLSRPGLNVLKNE